MTSKTILLDLWKIALGLIDVPGSAKTTETNAGFATFVREIINENYNHLPMLSKNGTKEEAETCLSLDVMALIMDIFITVQNNVDDVDDKKSQIIVDTFYKLNPSEFLRVKEARFSATVPIDWHLFANMTVAEFKNFAFKIYKSQSSREIEEITKNIKEIDNDKVQLFIFQKVKSLASKQQIGKMLEIWKKAATHPLKKYEQDRTVECGIQ